MLMKTYMMTLKRMMMMALLLMVTVSAMAAEQNIWLRITGNGKAQVSLDGKALTFDKDNKATVKGAEGLKVAVSVKPDNGYTVKSVTAQLTIDAGKAETRGADDASFLKVEQNADGDYIFTMPEEFNVIIFVTFTSSSSGKGGGDRTIRDDYSGTYYIASCGQSENLGSDYTYSPTVTEHANNFYLCPTEDWLYYNGDNYPNYTNVPNGQPFMTTFKCKNATDHPNYDKEAMWTLIKHPTLDYYYIRRNKDGKYLVRNINMKKANKGDDGSKNRLRVHLETPSSPGNDALFAVTIPTGKTSFVISPKTDEGWYINVHQGNFDELSGQQVSNTNKNDGPTSVNQQYKNVGGTIGIYTDINDPNSQFILEDIIQSPVITQQNDNTITITYPGKETVTLYYTTDGSKPDPTEVGTGKPTQIYEDNPIQMTNPVTTVKVVAVKTKNTDETLDTYSRVVSLTTQFYIGSEYPYLVQSQENSNYYMIPVTDTDNANGFTKTHTTTLGQPSMMWYFKNAGNYGGVQYYYMVNKSTGQYVYYHIYNSNQYMISINSAETFEAITEDEDKDSYRFSISEAEDGGYNICPKNDPDRSIYKNTSNKHNGYINAGSKTNALGRWNMISVTDEKMPSVVAPITVSTTDGATYYSIENEKLTGNYISPDTYVNTATSVTDNEKWCFAQAANDDWLTYYYIINAVSGEYLYLNQTGTDAMKTGNLDLGNVEKYQFVLAPSATNGFYIIPRSLATQNTRLFTSLYYNNTSTLQTTSRRFWSDDPTKPNGEDAYIKWTFNEVSLTSCQNVKFSEEDNKIILSCPTFGTKICYTTDGSTPTSATETVFPDGTDLPASNQYLIKAIAVLKNNTAITSGVVTLLNKPDIILKNGDDVVDENTYTYDGNTKEPTVFEVSIGEASNKTTATADTDYETVVSTDYTNNTNASTDAVKAKVTLRDKSSSIFIWHAEKEFKINPKEVGLTWTPDDSGQTTFTYTGVAQAPTVTASGLIGTDECTVTVTVTADEGSSLKDGEAVNIGSYTATASPLENTNYKLPDAKTRPFTITRAPVTVTADDKTWGFGDDEPELTATITGLVNNESEDLIIYTISRADIENSDGTYTITPAGLTEQGNYSVTYVTGVFTISKKAIGDGTVPAEGITIDITYNGNDYQVTVKHGGNEIGQGTDYTWDGDYNDPAHPEYYVVTVTGMGNNYTGEAKAIYIQLAFDDTTPNDDTKSETAAAYYATQNLQLSGGIEAWYVTSLMNNALTFEKVKVVEGENEISYLPANQPVILFGNSSSTGFMLKPYTGTTMEIPATGEGANILKAVTDADIEVHLGEVYVFSKGEFVLTMAGDLKKGKVYLDNPAYNSSSFSRGALSATRGGTTGINDVHLSKTNDQFNEVWYALDGQKLNKKPTRKGIYLQNGKKVVIK